MRSSATSSVRFRLTFLTVNQLLNLLGKANNVADLQKERKETNTVARFREIKKEFKDDSVTLKTLLQGDVQRTKNALQDHPKYQRTYQYKQSYEVAKEIENQKFLKQKKLDLLSSERRALMTKYEENLVIHGESVRPPKIVIMAQNDFRWKSR